MVQENAERLKKYLDMISRGEGGIEGVMHKLSARPRPAEESAGGRIPRSAARRPDAAALESAARPKAIPPRDLPRIEAIISEEIRPAIDIIDGTFTVSHPLWTRLSDDASNKARIEAAIPLVGRIELPGSRIPYGGTGFVVGPGLVMTNRHVAELFAEGLGDKRLSFKTGAVAGIDLKKEHGRPAGTVLSVRKVVMIHPYWDMALLAVDGLPAGKPLALGLADARDLAGRDIFIVGYPAFDPRNPTSVQNDIFEGRYGVKKLQPGQLQGGVDTSSFGKPVAAATHDVSTLGGNSGSAMFDLDSGEVLGLHFGGRFHERNYAVPAAALSRDDRVIAAGVNFAGNPPGGGTEWSGCWLRADAADPDDAAGGVDTASPGTGPATVSTPTSGLSVSTQHGCVVIDLPLRITFSLGQAVAVSVEPAAVDEAGAEAMREPDHDSDYSTRKGYDPGFLNDPAQDLPKLSVAMPKPASAKVLAKTRDGATVLHYQNFSLSMHAERRLALFTACNVTRAPDLRKPEPGRDYTRRGLSGLGKNDQERWFVDPRLEETLQLPDIFFTKDRKAFDKGHIVRRDDVAWGRTYDEVRRANGDSYHVTNCSPQIGDFNRSASGRDNWGDLENHVLSEAANERLCVFAGPVLDPGDAVFVGAGGQGVKLRARIPSRYWKVIVSRVDEGLAAYGFVLEQELADVDFEFQVPSEFMPALVPLSEIEKIAGVRFGRALRQADQFASLRGDEVVLRQGIKRKTTV
ncbi:MAG: DNA/RNA non-specific endonuclease [Pseudomonadota bacterium]|nr:DNA/RNA non-specific endonuclease [Pseudomonadota bacterium]